MCVCVRVRVYHLSCPSIRSFRISYLNYFPALIVDQEISRKMGMEVVLQASWRTAARTHARIKPETYMQVQLYTHTHAHSYKCTHARIREKCVRAANELATCALSHKHSRAKAAKKKKQTTKQHKNI